MSWHSDLGLAIAGSALLFGGHPLFGGGFSGSGIVTLQRPGYHVFARGVRQAPDGKIYVHYDFLLDTAGGGAEPALARLNSDGSIDASFGDHGVVVFPLGPDALFLRTLNILPDGRVVLAGQTRTAGDFDFLIYRLRTDGSRDPTFGQNGQVTLDLNFGSDDLANALAVDDDGSYWIGGSSATGGRSQIALVHLLPNGDLDENFANGGVLLAPGSGGSDEADQMYRDSSGKLWLAGFTHAANASGQDLISVRYLPGGELDTSYGQGGTAVVKLGWQTAFWTSARVRPDGKFVLSAANFAGVGFSSVFVQLNADGSIDPGFGVQGLLDTQLGEGDGQNFVITDAGGLWAVTSGGNGNIYQQPYLGRFLPNGAPDSTFGQNGIVSLDTALGSDGFYEACSLVPAAGGDYLALYATIPGGQTDYVAQLVRLKADGTLDTR
jgi:uncharacterized delta-60 repeat protein